MGVLASATDGGSTPVTPWSLWLSLPPTLFLGTRPSYVRTDVLAHFP